MVVKSKTLATTNVWNRLNVATKQLAGEWAPKSDEAGNGGGNSSCRLRCSNAVRLGIRLVDVSFTPDWLIPGKRSVKREVTVIGAGIGRFAPALALA